MRADVLHTPASRPVRTELGSGSSHLAIRTCADFDPATGGFVLSTPDRGAAKFMPNVALPGVAKTVPAGCPGHRGPGPAAGAGA